MTKSVYSQRGKSGDKSIKRDTKWPNDVKKWKKQFHIFFKKHQNRANIRKPEKAAKNWEFQCTNKPKDTKTAQTCQKSRERWQKINKNRSNMSESQRKVTKLSANKLKGAKTAQTCQKSREKWQKINKNCSNMSESQRKVTKLNANKPKGAKATQTCQKAGEKWQKIECKQTKRCKRDSNMPESQRKVTKNWVQTNQKAQKTIEKAQTQNENNKQYNIVQAVKSFFFFFFFFQNEPALGD